MITDSQSHIFKRLYVRTANQEHIKKWALENLTHQQASPIISKIIKLTYDMAKKQPDTFVEIQNWGREQVKALGYEEPQISKSL